MEEEESGKSWLKWLIIVPAAMAAGMLLTKLILPPRKAAQAVPAEKKAEARPVPAASKIPRPAVADSAAFDLPGDESAGAEAGTVWAKKAPSAAQKEVKAAPAPVSAADPGEAKKFQSLGLAYGALTKAAGKLLNNPKAVSALLNNDYVVKGFMSRDTVKNATASASSLASYLKNPANMEKFMGKEAVQRGIDDPQLVGAVASSKLTMSLLETPGGQALLKDPNAIAGILQANPALLEAFKNPAILNALVQNPKTAGIIGQVTMAGASR